ncbi:ATP-binding protein [Motilimonas eburnea]|uniref:ATP-binding protein n=1 Tax=Motilimonas eburnea TaxID=1737488 RepID=UPI001E482B9B|nr:ATP-binding protein [Motilimonas eburnea]MCE2572930.1 response regulator [Motilimonas eburnea]
MSRINNLHWVAVIVIVMAIVLVVQGMLLSALQQDGQARHGQAMALLDDNGVKVEQALLLNLVERPEHVKQAVVSAMSLKGLRKIIVLDQAGRVIFANNSIWLHHQVADLADYVPILAANAPLSFEKQFQVSRDGSLLHYTKQLSLPFTAPLAEVKLYFEYEFLEPAIPFEFIANLTLSPGGMAFLLFVILFIAWFYRAALWPLNHLSLALQNYGKSKERLYLDEQGASQIRRLTRLFNNIHHRQNRARRQTQEQLQQHLAIFSAIDDGVVLLSEKGHVLALNPAACRLFQANESSLVGCYVSQLPGNAINLNQAFMQVQKDGQAMEFSGQLNFMFDSSTRHVAGQVSRINAEPPQYLVCMHDTSPEHYLEAAIASLSEEEANTDPLTHICNSVANALNMPWVYIVRRESGSERLYLLAGCQGQQFPGQADLAFSPLYELFHQGDMLMMGEKVNQVFGSDPFVKAQHLKSFFAVPLHDDKGQVAAALCAMHFKKSESHTVRDLLRIAARRAELEMQYKAQDKQIRASDLSLRQLLDNVPHMITMRDRRHQVQLENLAARQFRQQLAEQQANNLTAQSVMLAEKVKQGVTLREIRENTTEQGQVCFHEVVCSPYHQVNSRQAMTLEVATDVTELMQAKTTLQRKVNILDALNEVHRSLVTQDNDAKLLHEICHILAQKLNFPLVYAVQLDHDEALELNLVAAISELESVDSLVTDYCLSDIGLFQQLLENQHVIRINSLIDYKLSNTSHRLASQGLRSMMAIPIQCNDKVTHAICIYGPKSDYFDQEDELIFNQLGLDLSLALEHQQTTSTKRQLELQLMQTQKMEAIGQLTAGVAHDFNNILASILGFTELSLMRVSLEEDKIADYLKQVITAGKRAQDLVAQMLAFSRPSDQFHQAAVPLTLAMALKEGCRMLAATLGKDIQLDYQIGRNANQAVAITPTEFHQVLMNLVLNARDAMNGEGEIKVGLDHLTASETLECRSCRSPFQGEYLVLTVTDTGSGMEEAVIRNIFSPFYTTKEVGKGTGMGLSVIHGLVHNLGGHIRVVSTLGQGSEFKVYFPVSAALSAPIEAPALSVFKYPSLRNKRVLLVDDETSILEFLTDLLTAAEVKVSAFSDAQQAFDAFMAAPQSFDIVVTDVMMPRMTGLELARRLTEYNTLLPVVAISGDDIANLSSEQSVFVAQLEKPFSAAVFMETLADLFTPVSA